ncbi:MAG TPA: response regulator [Pyrinomonadaceae bacterium]|jgi:DNA-binding response OmpR family regulator
MNPHRNRLLCVDDDEDTRTMLVSLLGLINCEVITVGTSSEAWDKIMSQRFDLYLLDNWLPEGPGVELCRKIRELDSRTPIVFYSGAAYISDKQEALAAGADAYLVKPAEVGGLVETIQRLLQTGRAASS